MNNHRLLLLIVYGAILAVAALGIVQAADWSNPNPQAPGDYAGQVVVKHESNMTDLYQATTGKLNQLKGSFAGTSGPATPNNGQPWYDSTNNLIKWYYGSWGGVGLYSSGTSSFTGGVISSGTNTWSGSQVVSGNINSSGTNTLSGAQNITGASTVSGNINSSGTNTWSGAQDVSGNVTTSGTTTLGGTVALTGTTTVSGNLSSSATTTISTGNTAFSVAAGTAPFTVPTTTTKVTNLNADYLDGFHGSQTPTANQAAVLSSAGDLDLSSSASGKVILKNNTALQGKMPNGTAADLVSMSTATVVTLGSTSAKLWDATGYPIYSTDRAFTVSGNILYNTGTTLGVLGGGEQGVQWIVVSVPANKIAKIRRLRYLFQDADARLRIKDGSGNIKYTSSAAYTDTDANSTFYDNSAGGAPSVQQLGIYVYAQTNPANLTNGDGWLVEVTFE